MRLVIVESPLSPSNGRTFEQNIRYAKLCALDCIRRGEAPYASHLLMTQFLDDSIPEERLAGMEAGFAWGAVGDKVAVYDDFGISAGMKMGIQHAQRRKQQVEYRKLPRDLMALIETGTPTKTEGM